MSRHVQRKHPLPNPLNRYQRMAELSCSICLNVLRQPVTLPCGHEFCLSCLRDAIEKTSCDCPLCRHRLTCWIRTRRRGGEWDALVNHERWTEIQTSGKRVLRRKRRLDAAERSENEGKSGRSCLSGFCTLGVVGSCFFGFRMSRRDARVAGRNQEGV